MMWVRVFVGRGGRMCDSHGGLGVDVCAGMEE